MGTEDAGTGDVYFTSSCDDLHAGLHERFSWHLDQVPSFGFKFNKLKYIKINQWNINGIDDDREKAKIKQTNIKTTAFATFFFWVVDIPCWALQRTTINVIHKLSYLNKIT